MSEHQHHIVNTIDRSHLDYWINGAGAWASRFECSSHDYVLMIVSIVSCLIMTAMYIVMAIQNRARLHDNVLLYKFFNSLSNFFIVCLFIHVLNSIIAWFTPVYWIINFLMLFNIYQSYKMIHSRQLIDAVSKSEANEKAIFEAVSDLKALEKHQDVRCIKEITCKIENILEKLEACTIE